jgi:hypothetical protein
MQPASLLDIPRREPGAPRPITPEMRRAVADRIRAAALDGRLPCAAGFSIARGLGVAAGEVGRVADELGIRVSRCQLGCF